MDLIPLPLDLSRPQFTSPKVGQEPRASTGEASSIPTNKLLGSASTRCQHGHMHAHSRLQSVQYDTHTPLWPPPPTPLWQALPTWLHVAGLTDWLSRRASSKAPLPRLLQAQGLLPQIRQGTFFKCGRAQQRVKTQGGGGEGVRGSYLKNQ